MQLSKQTESLCRRKSGCCSCSGDQMVSRAHGPVAAGITPPHRTSFSLQTPHTLWSHCTPAPKAELGGLKISGTGLQGVKILTPQDIYHISSRE